MTMLAKLAGAAGILALGGGLIWSVRSLQQAEERTTELGIRIEDLRRENGTLRQESDQLATELNQLRERLEAVTGEKTKLSALAEKKQTDLERQRQAQTTEIAQVRNQLRQSEQTVAELRTRVDDLRASISKQEDENQNLEEAQRRLKEEVAASRRVTSSLEQQLKDRDRRLASLEAGNEQLRQQQQGLERQGSRIAEIASKLEETYRRREMYLNNILRRYRDLTEDFRTAEPNSQNPDGDRARIQNVLSLTDEDLRQLSSLNARASQLLAQLAKQP